MRPLYDKLKKKCNSINMERNICIDEQMIPFKGHLSVKQYMRGKHGCPWGIKIFLLCGESGIIYDLLFLTEINTENLKKFGLGFVLHLTKNVEKIGTFDNFFSTFQLFEISQKTTNICSWNYKNQ